MRRCFALALAAALLVPPLAIALPPAAPALAEDGELQVGGDGVVRRDGKALFQLRKDEAASRWVVANAAGAVIGYVVESVEDDHKVLTLHDRNQGRIKGIYANEFAAQVVADFVVDLLNRLDAPAAAAPSFAPAYRVYPSPRVASAAGVLTFGPHGERSAREVRRNGKKIGMVVRGAGSYAWYVTDADGRAVGQVNDYGSYLFVRDASGKQLAKWDRGGDQAMLEAIATFLLP